MGLDRKSSPCCFTSYSWDSNSHVEWVRYLSEQLQKNGVYAQLDQWDLKLGSDVPNYMETSIRESDFVILVCTPQYAKKANEGTGGAGYEKEIITGEIFLNVSSPTKFIPLLRQGSPEEALPSYLSPKFYVDFRNDQSFNESMEKLLRHIHDMPSFSRPPLGSKPSFSISRSQSAEANPNRIEYCSRCGASVGEQSVCTGLYTSHDFTSGSGTIYCSRCGVGVGEQSVCTGIYTSHDFIET